MEVNNLGSEEAAVEKLRVEVGVWSKLGEIWWEEAPSREKNKETNWLGWREQGRKTQEMDFLHTEKREADGDGVLGPRKENSGLQGPCWIIWLWGKQNRTLSPALMLWDLPSPAQGTYRPQPKTSHPLVNYKCHLSWRLLKTSCLPNISLIASTNLPLNMKPPWSVLHAAWSLGRLSPLLAWIKVTYFSWGRLSFSASARTVPYSWEFPGGPVVS